jgi:chromosome segregation ATPase
MYITRNELDEALERHLKPIREALGLIREGEQQMSETGAALEAEIAKLDTDQVAENEAIVNAGNAITAAGTKFTELKTQIEGLQSSGVLTEEQATALLAKATEVDGHIEEGTTQLTEHVAALNEDATAA